MSNLRGHFFMENAEEMLLPWKNNPNFVPIVLTHVITFVIGLVGNIVVISTMSRGHGERSVTRSDDHLILLILSYVKTLYNGRCVIFLKLKLDLQREKTKLFCVKASFSRWQKIQLFFSTLIYIWDEKERVVCNQIATQSYIYTGPLYIFFVFPVNSLAAILDRI